VEFSPFFCGTTFAPNTFSEQARGAHVIDGSSDEQTQNGEAAMTAEPGRPHEDESSAAGTRVGRGARPVKYVVLPSAEKPFLLARVRWPDVYQAISPVRPDWQDDPGLFDLPYAPASVLVSHEAASRIADEWGAEIPSEEGEPEPGATLIRRMPSNWSNLSTAERRAWSIEIDKSARQALAAADAAAVQRAAVIPEGAETPAKSRFRLWGRRRTAPVLAQEALTRRGPIAAAPQDKTLVIDLTETATIATADFA
jgi:hypothetical protein